MKKTRLDNWICEIESLPELTREGLERLQLKRLNETLARLKARGGAYRAYPEKLGQDYSPARILPRIGTRFKSASDMGRKLLRSVS